MSRVGESVRHVIRGCRLLDYTRPETHMVIPRVKYLLGSRAGLRYDDALPLDTPSVSSGAGAGLNGCTSEAIHYERPELLTIYYMLRRKPELGVQAYTHPQLKNFNGTDQIKRVWPELRKRLGLHSSNFFTDDSKLKLDSQQRLQVAKWVDCALAPDLAQALEMIQKHTDIPWPPHIVLYTYARHCRSALDAYTAVRQLEVLLPQMPRHIQPELTVMALRMAQQHLLDFVPVIIRIFLAAHGPPSAPVANELLWRIALYGTTWDAVDVPLLVNAQAQIVKAAGMECLDEKGVFAMCYAEHFRDAEVALRYMEHHRSTVPSDSTQQSKEFAYTAGPTVMQILTAPTPELALSYADHATTHRSAIYMCATQSLVHRRELTADVATKLFLRIKKAKCLSARFTELIISALPSMPQKLSILSLARQEGLRLTPALVCAMARVNTNRDLDEFKRAYPSYLTHPLVREQLLKTTARIFPEGLWDLYRTQYASSGDAYSNADAGGSGGAAHPSRQVLTSMCRAAWNPKLLWDGMYAAQRCTAEVKQHVRGVAAPADDVLRVYPNEALLHAYVVMLGRSHYHNELINCLEWMDKLEYKPSKRVLLSIIHYSPQGAALLRMGQKLPGWPSEQEYDLFRKMNVKQP